MHDFTAKSRIRSLPAAAAVAFLLLLTADALVQRDMMRIGMAISLLIVMLVSASRGRPAAPGVGALSPAPAPQVAQILQRDSADVDSEISIICADIRDFTRFSAHTPSADVMQFLREYYDAVGQAVAAHGGTIKDYAGDGVLILVGAPTPLADHATRAIAIAAAVRDSVLEVTNRWTRADLPLSVGVGVASGAVTLGVVGSAQRREFAAVGPAVNLAARLCSQAKAGEILLDARARDLAEPHHSDMSTATALQLKGFDTAVASFAL